MDAVVDEYIPKREPLPVPRRVHHPSMANWSRQDTSNWANRGAKPKGQIIIQAEYEGAVVEASVMKGTSYSLCALRSRIKVQFGLAKFRLEYSDENDKISVTNQVEFDKAVKLGEKSSKVVFQVVNKVGNEEEVHKIVPRRVAHPSIASQEQIRAVVSGNKPTGQIQVIVEYKDQVLEIAVLRSTTYTLCALRSRVKTKFGLDYVSLSYTNENGAKVPVTNQGVFVTALELGEKRGSVSIQVMDKLEEKQEKTVIRRVEHPTMASWNKKLKTFEAVQGRKPTGQVVLKMVYEGKVMEVNVMKNTTYTFHALKSRVKANFCLSDIGVEYLDEDGDLVSVGTEVEFEKALKMAVKTGIVCFQVINEQAEKEDGSGPRRVHHPAMASWNRRRMASEAVQGKKPGGQIMLKFDLELRAMKLSVTKNTTYTLQALKSKIKARFGVNYIRLRYYNKQEDLVSVDTQDEFEEALKVGEERGAISFIISAKVEEFDADFVLDEGNQPLVSAQ